MTKTVRSAQPVPPGLAVVDAVTTNPFGANQGNLGESTDALITFHPEAKYFSA